MIFVLIDIHKSASILPLHLKLGTIDLVSYIDSFQTRTKPIFTIHFLLSTDHRDGRISCFNRHGVCNPLRLRSRHRYPKQALDGSEERSHVRQRCMHSLVHMFGLGSCVAGPKNSDTESITEALLQEPN